MNKVTTAERASLKRALHKYPAAMCSPGHRNIMRGCCKNAKNTSLQHLIKKKTKLHEIIYSLREKISLTDNNQSAQYDQT
jgi:hypothetical protein